MSHGHTRIASRGSCIYCGATAVKLADEHAVPLSLGGQHILEGASCRRCADITSKFELDVARELWGDARISYDAPSRRKKQRKTHIVLRDPANPDRKVKVPYRDYPAPMVFYKMAQAGLLQGFPECVDISAAWQFVSITDDKKAKEFEKSFGIPLTAKLRHVPNSFARLIIKAGYCHVLCSLDPGDFRPICLPYILGEKKNPSYVVGGSFNVPEPDAGMGYVLRTAAFISENRMMIVALVRLFASSHTPDYHVVVGDVTGEAKIQAVLQKMGDMETTILTAGPRPSGSAPQGNHWVPQAWPLPFWNT